jgi:hypothetical protein
MKTELLKNAEYLLVCVILGITLSILLKVCWMEKDIERINESLDKLIMEEQMRSGG